MVTLLDLSPELVHRIVLSLARSDPHPKFHNDTELSRLAATCQTLHQITEPLLYSKFRQRLDLHHSQTQLFLRTILKNPALAAQVKYLALSQTDFIYDREYWDEDKDEDGDESKQGSDKGESSVYSNEKRNREGPYANAVIAAFENLHIASESRETWVAAIRKRNQDALTAILLLSHPNVEELSISLTEQDEDGGYLQSALKNAIHMKPEPASGPFLKALRHVKCDHRCYDGSFGIEEVEYFFYIPSLRTLSFSSLSVYNLSWHPAPTSSNIEVLDLTSCGVDSAAWASLLTPLKFLKKLIYSPGNPKFVEFADTAPSAIGASLTVVKNTLESLSLTKFYFRGANDRDFLGSLKFFPRLKEVDVHLAMLIGTKDLRRSEMLWELLPSSLEELVVMNARSGYGHEQDREDSIDQLLECIARKATEFPRLKKLTVPHTFGSVKVLSVVCEANGVLLMRRLVP
ncbi:hypothetical protein BP5796_12914 [Coleophoma crateriformis]|uniref:F-box domain-containing protein n=1 Tax=Coleophoma crateriformis TaxID=565419 RepID=A0A3D8Q584_9HELO|nr:hypothetical protein BP5796_12914 [Coleophoma crateriformis]